jgi:hypothetical protein
MENMSFEKYQTLEIERKLGNELLDSAVVKKCAFCEGNDQGVIVRRINA